MPLTLPGTPKMLDWMGGNTMAVDTALTLCSVADSLRDLIGDDKEVSEQEINTAFTGAFQTLFSNPFYQHHQASYFPILGISINAWMDANALVKSSDKRWRMLAFYIRLHSYEVTSLTAYLVGGWDHLRKVSLEMRMFFETETYSEWEHRYGMD